MIEFIREFPILSLFIFGWGLTLVGGYFYDKPKYWKYWKITNPMVYAGLAVIAVIAISGILKLLGF